MERQDLYERLTPEALERLNAVDLCMRNDLIDILKAQEFWTKVTVGDMHALLVYLDYKATYQNFVLLFNDSK